MATMNVSLPDSMKTWAETRLQDGRFSNMSDYVRYLIRHDQERQVAIATLQKAIDKGTHSGEPQPFNAKTFKANMRERYVAK